MFIYGVVSSLQLNSATSRNIALSVIWKHDIDLLELVQSNILNTFKTNAIFTILSSWTLWTYQYHPVEWT